MSKSGFLGLIGLAASAIGGIFAYQADMAKKEELKEEIKKEVYEELRKEPEKFEYVEETAE